MKFGIIGDIHSNLEALTKVINLFKEQEVDNIFCLGDIVGYNANPAECVNLLNENGVFSVSGNHDRFASGEIDAVIRRETREAIDHTKASLNDLQKDFIASLPEERYFNDVFLFVHGSPRHKDEYINSLQVARSNLQFLTKDRPFVSVCFYGHTHLPYVISNNHIETDIHSSITFKLNREFTYLINPGSVGQPRDQCPLCSCAIFNVDDYTISYFRLEYDIKTTQEKILDVGLSHKLADRLKKGR